MKKIIVVALLALAAVVAADRTVTLSVAVPVDIDRVVPLQITEVPDSDHGVLCYVLTPTDTHAAFPISLSCVKLGEAAK